jgi:predicted dehydrogenase
MAFRRVQRPPVRLGVVGCGDVAKRRYLPSLAALTGRAAVIACCDRAPDRAEEVATLCQPWAQPVIHTSLESMLVEAELDAVLNLTPAPAHAAVSAAALTAGKHVYSEKPLAGDVQEASSLIDLARSARRLLMCAPAIMAAPRFRWLRDVLVARRLGRPTLACAHLADMGPASWRAYEGDPEPIYGASVGTLIDQGLYMLHAVTGLLGPARRVQAMGGVAIPDRTIAGACRRGEPIRAEAPDHVLVQLELIGGVFAQVLSSFAVASTRTPLLEVHGDLGSASLVDHLSATLPIHIYLRDDTPLGVEGWLEQPAPTRRAPATDDLVGAGAEHFVACLLGEERPVLGADHARHVLEIVAAIRTAMTEGRSVEVSTTFSAPT